MRLGAVSYTNALPLTAGLRCEIFFAPPSMLLQKCLPEDILLNPIVSAFQETSWICLEGVGIGCNGPVETVKLFFKNSGLTLRNIKNIYLDTDSRTSVALLKILLTYYYKVPSGQIDFSPSSLEEADAALLIGDKVWDRPPTQPFIDLGAIWKDWTGLPFVFACWMTKKRSLARKWKLKLIETAANNLEKPSTLLGAIPPEHHRRTLAYWKLLSYELGESQKAGIALFHKYWSALNKQPMRPLEWV